MTPQIALTLAIIVGALIVFGTEKLRVDVVALLVLLTVGLTGLVGPKEVFAGFSNSAVITVWADCSRPALLMFWESLSCVYLVRARYA